MLVGSTARGWFPATDLEDGAQYVTGLAGHYLSRTLPEHAAVTKTINTNEGIDVHEIVIRVEADVYKPGEVQELIRTAEAWAYKRGRTEGIRDAIEKRKLIDGAEALARANATKKEFGL